MPRVDGSIGFAIYRAQKEQAKRDNDITRQIFGGKLTEGSEFEVTKISKSEAKRMHSTADTVPGMKGNIDPVDMNRSSAAKFPDGEALRSERRPYCSKCRLMVSKHEVIAKRSGCCGAPISDPRRT